MDQVRESLPGVDAFGELGKGHAAVGPQIGDERAVEHVRHIFDMVFCDACLAICIVTLIKLADSMATNRAVLTFR
jgi:hypothetical protein